MRDLITEAQADAERAFHDVAKHLGRTGKLNPVLLARWKACQRMADDIEAASQLSDADLDTLFALTHGELEAIIDADAWTPITESEYRALWGNR